MDDPVEFEFVFLEGLVVGTLKSFEYRDHAGGLHIRNCEFDRLNLLLGPSGAGKTMIMRTLAYVAKLAAGESLGRNPKSWTLDFTVGKSEYRWEVALGRGVASAQAELVFNKEVLSCNGETVIQRTSDGFLFKGQKLPKMKPGESGISLLSEEEALVPVRSWFRSFLFIGYDDTPSGRPRISKADLEIILGSIDSISDLQSVVVGPTILTAYLSQKKLPEQFAQLCESYKEIFPRVEDVKIVEESLSESGRDDAVLALSIKEYGVEHWIEQSVISSGMFKTFLILEKVHFAPPGTVLFVDEMENSLGSNCLGDMGDLFVAQGDRMQIIVTSHHPLLANTVPLRYWRIVQREQSEIRVQPAEEIEVLQTALKSKFDLLVSYMQDQESSDLPSQCEYPLSLALSLEKDML